MNHKNAAGDLDGQPPILLFRPFQTWTVSRVHPFVLFAVFSLLTFTHTVTHTVTPTTLHHNRWLRVFFSKLAVNSGKPFVSRSVLFRVAIRVAICALTSFLPVPLFSTDGHHDMQLQNGGYNVKRVVSVYCFIVFYVVCVPCLNAFFLFCFPYSQTRSARLWSGKSVFGV